MSLLSKIIPKPKSAEYFLTLAVEERKIRAAIAQVEGSVITIVGTGESSFSPGENETEAADVAISSAESNSTKEILVEKVIFALPVSYLEGDNVKPEYLNRLKKITKDLNLKPNGFIEYPQALAFSLEREEGSPATALLIYLEQKQATFSLVRVGKIYKNIVVSRGESIIDDFSTTIPQFETDIMPSRIILFDHGKDLESIRSDLLKYPWHKNQSFLHTPKVEILPTNDVTRALVEAAASSFLKNFDLKVTANSLEDEKEAEIETPPSAPSVETKTEEIPPVPIPVPVEKPKEAKSAGHLKIKGGTVQLIDEETAKPMSDAEEKPVTLDASIPHKEMAKESEETQQEIPSIEVEETFGFVETTEVKQQDKKKDVVIQQTMEVSDEEEMTIHSSQEPEKKKSFFSFFSTIITSVKNIFSKVHIPALSESSGGSFLGFIPALILLVLFVGYMTILYPKTTVSLIVYPLVISQKSQVVFTTSGSTSGNTIAVTSQTSQVTGDKTITATGKNQIGERGKGEVLIYNKTKGSKTFPKGTLLVSGDLRFSLDTDVTIASSSDTGDGLTFGKLATRATAVTIGPNGNIAGGTSLKFKDFSESDYTAKANQSFSGGTSREVTAISKDDHTNLENQLTQELLSKASQELSQKLGSGEKLLDIFPEKKVIDKKFSKDVGAEGKELSLTLTLSLTGYSYKEEDIVALAKDGLSSAPSGYNLKENSISVKTGTLTTDKTGQMSTTVTLSAGFLPSIDAKKIANELKGKSYDDTVKYAQSLEGVSGVSIAPLKSFPLIKNRLPLLQNNIAVDISSR